MSDDLTALVANQPGWSSFDGLWTYQPDRSGPRVAVRRAYEGVWHMAVYTPLGVNPTWGEAETEDVPRAARALLSVLERSDTSGKTHFEAAAFLRGRAGVVEKVVLPAETYIFKHVATYVAADGVVRHRASGTEQRERHRRARSRELEPVQCVSAGVHRKITFNGEPVVRLTTSGPDPDAVDAAHAESLAALTETVAAGEVQPELFSTAGLRRAYTAAVVDLKPARRTVPRPTRTPFAGWVAWICPATGLERRGIVTGTGKDRTVMPADGGEHLPIRTRSVKDGVWQIKDGDKGVPIRAVDGPMGEQDTLFDAA